MNEIAPIEIIIVSAAWLALVIVVVIDMMSDRNSEPDRKPWHYDDK